MNFIKSLSHIFIISSLLFGSVALADVGNVLPMPSGNYSVGYQDYHWINSQACPDFFYTGHNQWQYSSDDLKFCREMMVRVYYPALAPKVAVTPYDGSVIRSDKFIINYYLPLIPRVLLNSLDTVMTWENVASAFNKQSFPVIIFSPGYATNATEYSVLIDNLVSQGYIVVALDNTFISHSVTFPDGHTVANRFPNNRRTSTTVLASEADIRFVLQQLFALHQFNTVFAAMNLNAIGVMGHSLGADMAMYLGHEDVSVIKAVLALDPYDETSMGLKLNYQFSIPFLVMHADSWYCQDNHSATATLNKNGYWMVISQMQHFNFTDMGIFQYQTAFAYAIQNSQGFYNQMYNPNNDMLGSINGYWAIAIENAYITQFFNHYLKGEPAGWLNNAKPIFTDISGYYLGPVVLNLPSTWPGALCPDHSM